ncbi:hypothetical protein LCM4576_23540 [Mesorhizobium sp. LCM 4576]|uniref:hypothetical protein n=1 Tax=Mesorhizobium sp. LCM 4576 TaxID=1848289 RepID=UPI0008DA7EAB|nr:hypothetical protein [Mesorhizobium sp. LCM 4576]OHV67894.1 hypothetical protein LCM4576_23540 [Mesorhizobium sp. LCM 4576]
MRAVVAMIKTAVAAEPMDPLLAAINLYKFAGEAYDDMPEDLTEEQEAEAFERLCSDPEAVLAAWNSPASTRESALAAVRLALQIGQESDSEPTMLNLMKQALAYFEGHS